VGEDAGAVIAAVERVVDQAVRDQSRGSSHDGSLTRREQTGKMEK